LVNPVEDAASRPFEPKRLANATGNLLSVDRAFGFDHKRGNRSHFELVELKKLSLLRYRELAFFVSWKLANHRLMRLYWGLVGSLCDWRGHRRWWRSRRGRRTSIFDRDEEPGNLALWISEPVGTPDAMQSPPELYEYLLTEPVAIPS